MDPRVSLFVPSPMFAIKLPPRLSNIANLDGILVITAGVTDGSSVISHVCASAEGVGAVTHVQRQCTSVTDGSTTNFT